jgi:hypothetical protein
MAPKTDAFVKHLCFGWRMQPARSEKKLRGLQAALAGMFNQMDQAISATTFETNNDLRYSVTTFLIRFDAIFTLNQDLLLERII